MAIKETKNEPKDLVEAVPEEIEKLEKEIEKVEEKEVEKPKEERKGRFRRGQRNPAEDTRLALESWIPKTILGRLVKTGKEKEIDKILEKGKKILEAEIVDSLLSIETELILIGQAKGKFGGGKRRAWRQTQKKTKEGNVLSFSAMAVAGDKNGHIGVGFGKASETLPAREKAVRKAKLNITKINLGFESPEEEKEDSKPHTVPFKVQGKCGSNRITLWPAPRGTGLAIGDECKKILKLAGIKDIYAKTQGHTKTTFNLAKACMNALEKTTELRLQ
ncbi:MAG: 30S ribosomal protein S5 [Nanoarchaeota archaeon]|nr:30S ribosomal protein S5 [Nanoarchaeota archaeon]MBU1051643.1 30S ribosomal protein S5 [Nanoarchaeota archaeon]